MVDDRRLIHAYLLADLDTMSTHLDVNRDVFEGEPLYMLVEQGIGRAFGVLLSLWFDGRELSEAIAEEDGGMSRAIKEAREYVTNNLSRLDELLNRERDTDGREQDGGGEVQGTTAAT